MRVSIAFLRARFAEPSDRKENTIVPGYGCLLRQRDNIYVYIHIITTAITTTTTTTAAAISVYASRCIMCTTRVL